MGQTIFTTQFLSFESKLYTALWLRLHLKDYKMRKSLRKIVKKVENNFRVIIQPATFGLDKEILFEKYKKEFKGNFNSSVSGYMLDHQTQNIYNTLECLVYDDNKLIAFSYFDIGATATASILGVYDPDYKAFSLGIYTMLKEVNWAVENGYEWYYPGYFVPGYERFDYKCRVGAMEYYDYTTKKWGGVDTLDHNSLLTEKLKKKLFEIHNEISEHLNNGYLVFYRYYDVWYQQNWKNKIYDHPLLLLYVINRNGYIVEYDFKAKKYRLSRIITFNLNFTINPFIIKDQKVVELLSPLMCEEVIFESASAKEMLNEILLLHLMEKSQ